MLVISRLEGESIVLFLPGGDRITLTVERTGAHKVRLGIEAPPTVGIWRDELLPVVQVEPPARSEQKGKEPNCRVEPSRPHTT